MKKFGLLFITFLTTLLVLSSCLVLDTKALIFSPPDADTFLDTNNPNQIMGSYYSLGVEGGTGLPFKWRTLLKFDLSSIPPSSTINEATLRLYIHGGLGTYGTPVTVYRVTEEWGETQATWNNRLTGMSWIGVDPLGAGGTWTTVGAVTVTPTTGGWISWTVTDIVKAWIEGGQTNYGFLIKVTDEAGDNCWLLFYSKEFDDGAYWPILEIDYDSPQPSPVGGISTPINKLEFLTPYIALAGLIVAVSTVYVIKRRKD